MITMVIRLPWLRWNLICDFTIRFKLLRFVIESHLGLHGYQAVNVTIQLMDVYSTMQFQYYIGLDGPGFEFR